jgi:uncharacterized membrane protein
MNIIKNLKIVSIFLLIFIISSSMVNASISDDFNELLNRLSTQIKTYMQSHFPIRIDNGITSGESGSGCFPAGTQISMEDGSTKNIEDIKPGDKVLGVDLEYIR